MLTLKLHCKALRNARVHKFIQIYNVPALSQYILLYAIVISIDRLIENKLTLKIKTIFKKQSTSAKKFELSRYKTF